jgi:hypothetical protein
MDADEQQISKINACPKEVRTRRSPPRGGAAGGRQGVGKGSNELHAGHGGDMTPKRSGAGGPESKEA